MVDDVLACRTQLPSLGEFVSQRNGRRFVARSRPEFSNANLVLRRLLPCHDKESEGRKQVLLAACNALKRLGSGGSQSLYACALSRRSNHLSGMAASMFDLATPAGGRLIVGLGSESPLETGITLHHTFGVPIIPGSALKGLASHYCDQLLGQGDKTLQRDWQQLVKDGNGREVLQRSLHHFLFGDTDCSGMIVFHDAWMDPASLTKNDEGMLMDVMTPHHGDYYGEKQYSVDIPAGPKKGDRIPPTDFDDPVPVQFLSVRGTFHFALSWNDGSPLPAAEADQRETWLNFVGSVLKAALADWGVGGKTSSGYGRLVAPSAIVSSEAIRAPSCTGTGLLKPAVTVGRPPVKERVEAEIVEKKAKGANKITWRAKHLASGMTGPIQNSEAIPGDAGVGTKLPLIVTISTVKEIAFKYPTPEITRQIEQPKARQQNRGPKKRH